MSTVTPPSAPSSATPTNSKRIAVLGAGPMGLAVAYQLAIDGYKPIVYEADDRIGGMAATFDFSGTSIERYYHFHCTSDQALFQVLEELNLSERLHWTEGKMGFWYRNRLQPWGNPIALFQFQGLGWIAKLRYGLHVFLSVRRNDWHDLDQQDAIAWVKKWVGPEAYEVLWRRLFEYKFYQYCENLSAAWIWSRIRRMGRSRYSLLREKLGYLEGGSFTVLQAMRKYIEQRGGEIHLSAPVAQVTIQNKQICGIKVHGKFERFDRVISTIPLPYVPKVIPDLPLDILEKFITKNNIAVVCVIVKLRQALTDYFWLNTSDPEMDIPGIIEYKNLNPSIAGHIVYVPFYMPGEHPHYLESDQFFLDKVLQYLQRINPLLTQEDFIEMRASRYRFAQPICEPRFLATLPPVQLPITGLWVADTSYYYPEDRGISESFALGRKIAKASIAQDMNQSHESI